jgi:hypothetical protein
VFCHDEERGSHGGEQGVYWLNRAVFHEAARNLAVASEAHWQAMHAADTARRGRESNANILQYLLYADRNLGSARLEAEIAGQPANRRALVAKVRSANSELHAGRAGPLAAVALLDKRETLSDTMLKDLSENAGKWGGTGRMLAAESSLFSRSFTQRRSHHEAAVRTSPLCYLVHMRAGPATDTLGTLTAANWKMAAAHSAAMAMIQPYSVITLLHSAAVLARSGGAPVGLAALSVGAVDRPIALDWGGHTLSAMQAVAHGRMYHQRLLHRRAVATGDALPPERIQTYRHLCAVKTLTLEPIDVIRYGLNVRGPSPRWVDYTLHSYARTHDFNDVNLALNMAITLCIHNPEGSLRLVERADNTGVNPYGRFVGTQAWIGAKAKMGELSEGLPRYREVREGRVGTPTLLDNYLLAGLTNGNNHTEAESALTVLSRYDQSDRHDAFYFMLRRAHMMAGRHRQIAALRVPPNSGVLMEDAEQFTRLFHEARALLDIGAYEALSERARPYTAFEVEAAMGTYLDAAVLAAISLKLTEAMKMQRGRLSVIEPAFVDAFLGDEGLLDWHFFEMLCGRRDLQPLPEAESGAVWHASVFGERPSVMLGSGVMTHAEVNARDAFLRGVCLWLLNDTEGARKLLAQCVEADQRNSHEYHVAEWLLANPLNVSAD